MLRERVFLNSDWLVKTLYKVLDDKTIKEKMGRIGRQDICDIWHRDELQFQVDQLTRVTEKLREYFEQRLKVYLVSTKHKFGDIWSDVAIPAGSDWNDEIGTALERSDIGILLVSQSFLGSKYCMGEEFRRMIEKRKSEGYTIIPVLLRECNFHLQDELNRIQFVKITHDDMEINDPVNKTRLVPFDKLMVLDDPYDYKMNKYFLALAKAIDNAVKR